MRTNLFTNDGLAVDFRKIDDRLNVRHLSEVTMETLPGAPSIMVFDQREFERTSPRALMPFLRRGLRLIVFDTDSPEPRVSPEFARALHAWVPKLDEKSRDFLISSLVSNAVDQLVLRENNRRLSSDLGEMTRIGAALSSEKDNTKLLDLILRRSRQLAQADAGSIYLVEEGENDERRLRFKYTQNDSVPIEMFEFTLPINRTSIAGYVAMTARPLIIKDAYDIGREYPFQHQRWFDKNNNYRTISMLAAPMMNLKGEVVGVLQLINRKRDGQALLVDPYTAITMVEPFDEQATAVVESLASQAAVSLEKNLLHESIKDLFEGFVKASVTAIESRDPTTSGHSERVALLTVELAKKVDHVSTGTYAPTVFSSEDLQELRYSALLHDFGKVGVREHILVKADKLHPWQATAIRGREKYIRKLMEANLWRKRFELLKNSDPREVERRLAELDEEDRRLMAQLEEYMSIIWESNMPKVLPGGNFEKLQEIQALKFFDGDEEIHLLEEEEASILSIPKGSLTDIERLEIESHVTHTYEFLRKIPWTRELRRVPEIAYGHHERLNGTGYPRNLAAPEIPVQSKMMGITDVFDALTASDRPYKKAMSTDRALQIIGFEVKDGKLDGELFDIFRESEAYRVVEGR